MGFRTLCLGMAMALIMTSAKAAEPSGKSEETTASAGGRDGGGTALAVPEESLVVPWTRFNIQYTVRDIAGNRPRKIEFYVTTDMGKTWRYYGEDPDVRSPMTIQVPGEGVYGFVSIGTDAAGNRDRPPVSGTRPEIVVIVDRTPSTAAWLAPQADQIIGPEGVALAWESVDDHLGSRPVTIEYSADDGQSWKVVKTGLPAQGRFNWTPPAPVKGALRLRLIVRDRAGNTLRLFNKYRLLIDSVPPTVRITGPALAASDRFDVFYEAEDDASGVGVAKVIIWYTTDGGRTWERGAEDEVVKGRVRLQVADAEEIGIYGQAVDKAGNASPLPRSGMPPAFVVAIDMEKPKMRLEVGALANKAALDSGDKVTIRWSATDAHIKDNSVAIDIFNPAAKAWENLASNLPASGSWLWEVKRDLAGKDFMLRAVAADSAGNTGEARTYPFEIKGAKGATRISDVRAIDGDVSLPGKPDEEIVDEEEATVVRPTSPRPSDASGRTPPAAKSERDKPVQSATPAASRREPTPPPLPASLLGEDKEGAMPIESRPISRLPSPAAAGGKTESPAPKTQPKPPAITDEKPKEQPPQPPPPPSEEEWVESVAEKPPAKPEKSQEPARAERPPKPEERPVARLPKEPQPASSAIPADARAKADALVREAGEMFRHGQGAQALSRCSEALHLNPDCDAAYLLMVQIHLADGKNAEALAEAEKAARLRPGDPAVWRELGIAALSLARDIQDNEIAMRGDEEGPEVARLSERRDKAIARAREALQHLLRLAPDQKDTYDRMGDAIYLQARSLPAAEAQRAGEMYREAAEYYRKGMAIGQPTYRELFQVGVCALRMRQSDEAQRFLEQAVEAAAAEEENPREAFWYLADLLERQGKLREALRYWEKAAKAWESDERYREEAKKRAAQIKRTLGEP